MKHLRIGTIVATMALLAAAAEGVIKSPLELKKVLGDSNYILVAKVDQLFADKPAMTLNVGEDLKGKAPFRRLPINLTGDKEAAKFKHVPQLLDRLAPELEVVVFVNYDAKAKQYFSFVYTNGTWFQMQGQKTGADSVVWKLAHGEPYLRRTFKGTTEEMKQAVTGILAGKRTAPAYDAKEQPGFGPEVKK